MLSKLISILSKPGSKAEKYAKLTQFELFEKLNTYELFQMSNICHEREYAKGELIFDVGYPLEALFFILDGEITLTGAIQPHGSQTYSIGSVIGLIDLFYKPIRHSKAVSQTKSKVIAISREDFISIIDDNPRLGNKLLKIVAASISRHIFTLSSSEVEG